MAKKKTKKSGPTGEDILVGLLVAFASGAAIFFFALVGGAFLSEQRGTAEQSPPASQTTRGTLPSSKPTSTPVPTQEATEPPVEPSNEPEPERTVEPVRQTATPTAAPTQAPAQTQTPTTAPTAAPTAKPSNAPAHNPGPAISINPTAPPAQQTKPPTATAAPTQTPAETVAPVQISNRTSSNGDGTYAHDFSNGYVLVTTQSNNNGDPVYHTKNCRSASKIPPGNAYWYSSAKAATDAGRRLCGNCAKSSN